MHHLLKRFWDICRLRAGPQDLPASPFLLGLVLAVHWSIGVGLESFERALHLAMFSAAVSTLLVLALVQTILLLRQRTGRFLQTVTAMAGCEALIGLAAVPVFAAFHAGMEPALLELLSLLLIAWSLVVAGHVFRYALDVTFGGGILVALVYTLIGIIVTSYTRLPGEAM